VFERRNRSSYGVLWILLCVAVSLAWLVSPESAGAQVLDRVEIVETPDAAEIHIIFNTRALYLKHTPSEKGDLIRIFLGFPDLGRSQQFARALATPPPSDLIPKFSVTFPDPVTNGLLIQFEKPVRFRISQRGIPSATRIVIAVKLDRPRQLPPVPPEMNIPGATPPAAADAVQSFEVPAFRPGSDVEKYAEDVMKLGQQALNAGESEKAIQAFNAILKLPQNKQSQGAQEWIGMARQRSGDYVKAKAEYELYLKLYPEGAEATRVRGRLEALQKILSQTAQTKTGRQIRKVEETKVYGSLYTYYYGGFSQEKITDKTTNTTTNLNRQDQSMVQGAFDITGRYRKDEYDNKVVARGTQMYDDLATTDARRNISRLRALYVETSSQDSYLLRVGRQPGNSGGILDYRFDGAWFRYTAVPQLLNINLVGGQPRQFSLSSTYVPDDPRNFRLDFNRYFYGANVDIGPVGQAWSGNAYFLNQMVNGVVDRRAVGSELRYAANGKNAFGLVDYDISYGALNIAMLNGTWVTEGTTFTLMADHRRVPYLQTTNALFGVPNASLDIINTSNEALLRSQAKAITAKSDLFLVGVLHSVAKDWQLGGDVRLNRISGTSASNCLVILPGTSTVFLNPNATTDAPCTLQGLPGSGNNWTFSGQAIGNRFPAENMTLVMNGSYITSPAYKGQSITFNSLTRLNSLFQFDTFVILYHQKDNLGVNLYRVTPTIRVDYRFLNSWILEGSGGVEQTFSDSSTQKDSTTREFFFLGLRWDFS
jgi:tetratricopeptide (TPR) repeat protein